MPETETEVTAFEVVDANHPLYFHFSELSNNKLSTELLDGENYNHWRRSDEVTLSAKNKLDIVTQKYAKPTIASPIPYWERCNNMIIYWIMV